MAIEIIGGSPSAAAAGNATARQAQRAMRNGERIPVIIREHGPGVRTGQAGRGVVE
jgi:predicted secreted protein